MPVEKIVFSIIDNVYNDDWLRALRLKKKGDKKSLEELKVMENQKLKQYTGNKE